LRYDLGMGKGLAKIEGPPVDELLASLGIGGDVQKFIDSEFIRLNDNFVPSDTTTLRKSAILNTKIGSGLVVYSVYGNPRGRNTYNDVTSEFQGGMPNGLRGPFWAHRMLDAGGREKLAKGVMEFLKRHGG